MLIKHIMLGTLRPIYNTLSQFDPADTVVVAPSYIIGARLAQEKLHFPLATIVLQPFMFWSHAQPAQFVRLPDVMHKAPLFLRQLLFYLIDRYFFDRRLLPGLNALRKELELSPLTAHVLCHWAISKDITLDLFPEWFAAKP